MTWHILSRMHPDVALDIELSAIITRGKYTTAPETVIAELRTAAGERHDVLVGTVGSWIGYFGDDEYVRPLVDAMLVEFGSEPLRTGIELGRSRRGRGHTTP